MSAKMAEAIQVKGLERSFATSLLSCADLRPEGIQPSGEKPLRGEGKQDP